jgi:hypothetical protein
MQSSSHRSPRRGPGARLARLASAAALALPMAVAHAQPAAALQPMAFLAGHCWKGMFGDGQRSDEHCFAWLLGGAALRDTHVVHAPGQPDYVGDTTYYVDPSTKRVAFVYVENLGGVSRGSMASESGALVFADAVYVDASGPMTYRARWTPKGDDAYEAWSEAKDKDGWKTMFRMVLRRQP